MQVDVVIEQRFYQCKQGLLWTENAFPYDFWTRYLSVFSDVNIVARVAPVDQAKSSWKRVDGDNVSFTRLPTYLGPVGFFKSLPRLVTVIRARKKHSRAVIYRVPGILAFLYHCFAKPNNGKYAAEVVGDPMDVFAKDASKSSLRPLFKWLFVKMLQRQCAKATAIAYVTEYSLQRRYPPANWAFDTHYSSIQLSDDDYLERSSYPLSQPLELICIGNLAQPYKGCDIMLKAVADLHDKGVQVRLRWIGGGALLQEMQSLAGQLAISQYCEFLGNIAQRETIRAALDSADIFVLPSRQEGLPRVLIEAMARSLNCIATDVGGVKELLQDEYVIERDNVVQLSQAIQKMLQKSEEQRLLLGNENYKKATEYHNDVLAARRTKMYRALLESQS